MVPCHLWGTDADLAFLSAKHNKDFYKYGKEEAIAIPYYQLHVTLSGDYAPKKLSLDMMLKNVRHARYEIRTGAAKVLCANKQFKELEELLRDPDPRLRRAALDGINGYRAWFTSPAVGQNALKAGEYTPAMQEAVSKILSDPKEAWYVIDGALQALQHAPIELLKKNIPNIGEPAPEKRQWRYYSFDPVAEKDKRSKMGAAFRGITLPSGMDQWFNPGFKDSGWKSGCTPIGVGEFKSYDYYTYLLANPDFSIKNNSDWGNGEFLLMRSTFEVKDLGYDYYRINILASEGYVIYLDGQQIHAFIYHTETPRYNQIILDDKYTKLLKKGSNTLAVCGNLRYVKDKTTDGYHPAGQIGLRLEGLRKKELGLTR